MKSKIISSTLFGVAAWSLSSLAMASWEPDRCPQPHTGPAPCIEAQDNSGNYWHFNGDGGHADIWHGHPLGGDFIFSNKSEESVDLACTLASPNCNLALHGQVKKCQDSNGDWRILVKVTDADVTPGDFLCNFITVSGFPWYSKGTSIVPHCPFTDDCDNGILYDPNATSYTANFGAITVSQPLGTLVNGGHLHNVIFTPGVGAYFDFTNKTFFGCNELEGDCSINGKLFISNAISLDVH